MRLSQFALVFSPIIALIVVGYSLKTVSSIKQEKDSYWSLVGTKFKFVMMNIVSWLCTVIKPYCEHLDEKVENFKRYIVRGLLTSFAFGNAISQAGASSKQARSKMVHLTGHCKSLSKKMPEYGAETGSFGPNKAACDSITKAPIEKVLQHSKGNNSVKNILETLGKDFQPKHHGSDNSCSNQSKLSKMDSSSMDNLNTLSTGNNDNIKQDLNQSSSISQSSYQLMPKYTLKEYLNVFGSENILPCVPG